MSERLLFYCVFNSSSCFLSICNCVLRFHRTRIDRLGNTRKEKKNIVYLLTQNHTPHRPQIIIIKCNQSNKISFPLISLSFVVSLHIWWFGTYGINHRWQIGRANGDRANHAVNIFAHFLHHLWARGHWVEHARILRVDNDFPGFGFPFGDIGVRGQLCQHACIWIGTCFDLHPHGWTHHEEIRFGSCASSRHRRLCDSIAAIVQSKYFASLLCCIHEHRDLIEYFLFTLLYSDSRNHVFRNAQNCCEHFVALQRPTQITISSTIGLEIIVTYIARVATNRSSHIASADHWRRQQQQQLKIKVSSIQIIIDRWTWTHSIN